MEDFKLLFIIWTFFFVSANTQRYRRDADRPWKNVRRGLENLVEPNISLERIQSSTVPAFTFSRDIIPNILGDGQTPAVILSSSGLGVDPIFAPVVLNPAPPSRMEISEKMRQLRIHTGLSTAVGTTKHSGSDRPHWYDGHQKLIDDPLFFLYSNSKTTNDSPIYQTRDRRKRSAREVRFVGSDKNSATTQKPNKRYPANHSYGQDASLTQIYNLFFNGC